jgi:hypothetical protein
MKKMRCAVNAGLVLAAVFALTLLGCPKEADEEDQIDSRLVNSWTNKEQGGMKKEFTISSNGTFTASINPNYVGAYNKTYAEYYAQAYEAATGQSGVTEEAARQAAHQAGLTAAQGAIAGLAANSSTSDAATRWTVTGKLVKGEDDFYIMTNLHETSIPSKPASITAPEGSSADTAVGGYNTEKVQIEFNSDDTAFDFASATDNQEVTAFFGGTYVKK